MIKFFLYASFLSILLSSCSDDISKSYTPFSDYSGISKYDENGFKIEEVDNDWNPECYEIIAFEDNHLCFFKVFPLPATDTITIYLASAINGEIKLWLSLTEGNIEKEIYSSNIQVNSEKIQLQFDEDLLYRNVVYRLFVETTDTATGETKLHYGDVLWKNI